MPKISEIAGKRIFGPESNFIGTASDVMIDPSEGKVKFLIKGEIKSILGKDKSDAKSFIRDNFVPIESVKAIGNIIVLK